MRHKLREKLINRLHAKLNRGYDHFLEVLGHGCPLGIDPIDSIELSVREPKQIECYEGPVILLNDIPSYQVNYPIFEGDITPFTRGITGNLCRMYILDGIFPISKTLPIPHWGTAEYAQLAIIRRKKITEQRLKDGTAEVRNGMVWYKAKKLNN